MTPDFLTGAVSLVVFVFSVVVHENAHGIAAEHFGDTTARDMGRITMNPLPHLDPVGSVLLPIAAFISGLPFLGWAKPVPVDPANLRNPVVHNAYVAAAGPASNFLLAFAASLLWIVVGVAFKYVPGLAENGQRSFLFFNTLCNSMITLNCVLAIFNLLPIPPLDGHWIMMRYLPPGPREALRSVGRWGFFILIALLWTGMLWRIIGPPLALVVGGYHSLVTTAIRAF
ncbi:MAG: site-2 protease family protein [Candidatus Krumholzibacteria bacterium]|nr:site-2 protease family protein [Candidatus Krumholzibacteria bacterium]MDH4337695.1 site-2 protease family protein [Candidatus Krumholzibacteria bacterium]MDH5269866.1 site-2 protease family protein [Candidatus Krumholzibacteria bacterium]